MIVNSSVDIRFEVEIQSDVKGDVRYTNVRVNKYNEIVYEYRNDTQRYEVQIVDLVLNRALEKDVPLKLIESKLNSFASMPPSEIINYNKREFKKLKSLNLIYYPIRQLLFLANFFIGLVLPLYMGVKLGPFKSQTVAVLCLFFSMALGLWISKKVDGFVEIEYSLFKRYYKKCNNRPSDYGL